MAPVITVINEITNLLSCTQRSVKQQLTCQISSFSWGPTAPFPAFFPIPSSPAKCTYCSEMQCVCALGLLPRWSRTSRAQTTHMEVLKPHAGMEKI